MAGANSCLPAFRLLGVACEDDILILLEYLINHTNHLVMVDDDNNGGENDNRDYQDVRTLTKHHVYFYGSASCRAWGCLRSHEQCPKFRRFFLGEGYLAGQSHQIISCIIIIRIYSNY